MGMIPTDLPVVRGGETVEGNLALACVSCSLHKAARQEALDLQTGIEAALFNPRVDTWKEHFRWDGPRVVGLVPANHRPAGTGPAVAFTV